LPGGEGKGLSGLARWFREAGAGGIERAAPLILNTDIAEAVGPSHCGPRRFAVALRDVMSDEVGFQRVERRGGDGEHLGSLAALLKENMGFAAIDVGTPRDGQGDGAFRAFDVDFVVLVEAKAARDGGDDITGEMKECRSVFVDAAF